MQPHEKESILKGLKDAEAASLREQDGYRKVLTAIQETPTNDAILADHLKTFGWDRIEAHMIGHSWPPASQDWQTLQISWDQTPKQKSLNQIADQDIRFATYFFSEVSDHTKRLKAMAHFYGLYGAVNEEIVLTFLIWQKCDTLNTMQMLEQSIPSQPC